MIWDLPAIFVIGVPLGIGLMVIGFMLFRGY